ncbi:MAG: TonB-dependent receptor [Deltaproteobacteria bacterium]|nr:TonB-dependent receptor [Deltaproteobacteria bacterium]
MIRFRISLRTLSKLASVLAVLMIAFPAMAQTTGAIRGVVTDAEDDLPIPGVTITLFSDALIGGVQQRTTDNTGGYQFVELPPGDYDVTATKPGFKSVTVAGVVVQISRTVVRNVQMPLSDSTEETIEVVATRNPVDTEETSRGEVLTKDFLQKIPAGRSYQSAVQMAAGVTGGSGGNPNMGGAAYNENTYMLDGANITDPVTGTFSVNFNYDAIEQIEVVLGGYEPEYGVSLGGVVNLVTETGTNNLEFDSSLFYMNGNWNPKMDERLTADGYTLAPTGFDSNYQNLTLASKISGPIVRDKAWFIVSYQWARSLIANTGISVPRDFDGHYVLGKATLQPTSEHRFTTFIQMDPSTIDNLVQDDPFVKPEAQQRQTQGGYVTQGRWQWFLNPDANLDTQVVVQKSYIEVGSVPCTHDRTLGYNTCKPTEPEGFVDWETPGRTGLYGAYDSVAFGYFYFDDRYRYQASSKLSLLGIDDPLGGTHDLKAGVEAVQTVWDQIQGYAGNTLYYDLNEVSYDPSTFKNYYWLETTGPIKFRTTQSQWNAFVQDAWKPIPDLTVKYGTRFDNVVSRNDLGEPVLTGKLWGPRLYAAWDPFGDQKTKIGGGYGRFNDTGRLGVASFTSAANYGSKLYLGEYFSEGSGDKGYINGSGDMYDITPRENLNTSWDNLATPHSDELLVLFQRELVRDVAFGSNLTYKMTRFMYEFDQTNVVYDQDGSGVIGSRTGDPLIDIYRLRTPSLARRDYFQGDFYLDKVQSRRWAGRLTYSYTQSVGSSTQSLSGSFANDPQTQYNYGPMATDLRHVVKGYAYWSLPTDPWVQTIGVSFEYYSGAPLERYYYNDWSYSYNLRIRDRGIYHRFEPVWVASIKFSQDLDVKRGKLVLDFEVNNIFNNQSPDNFSSAFYTLNRLFAYSRQDPLRLQLGLRYQF